MQPESSSASELVLRVLRTSLHIGFAVLLVVGTVRLLASNPGHPTSYLALVLAVILGVVYLAGTLVEKRYSVSARGLDPQRFGLAWLALVSLLWVALSVLSADFSWLAFPLFFLHLHLLGPRHAILAVTVLTGIVVASQWWHSGGFSLPMLLGPMVGAVFAVVMGMAYGALYNEGVNQRLALEELRRTRVELAESQHNAGVLAERERLAREIHDTLAQGLSSIVLVSRAVRSALDADNADLAQERLQTVQETASENLAEARRFVRGLTEPEESLVLSLQRVCESTERRAAAQGSGLRCRFRLEGEPMDLPAPYEVTLLRAAQASLANVAAHANATTAVVTLSFLGEDVTMDVYDDGSGFDPATLSSQPRPDGTGYGLLSLRERVLALGGSLDAESSKDAGSTVIAIRLPLQAQAAEPSEESRS